MPPPVSGPRSICSVALSTACGSLNESGADHRWLITALEPLTFSEPVTHVYNPLVYARSV